MRLQLRTWQEVEDYLQRSTGIIIPIGSTEQHGPTGLLGTDAICPEIIAHRVGETLGALVAPTLPLGMAQHHLAFPGTASLRPTTLIALIVDLVNSLARHGFDHFYFLNGHGGNAATIQAGFAELYAETSLGTAATHRPRLRCKLTNWWHGPGVRALSKELFGAAEGVHATPTEVALTYFAYPNAVKRVPLEPRIAPRGEIRDAADYRRRFPDGRIGSDPSLATPEAGGRILDAAVAHITDDYRRFVAGGG
jgi:creatinine amidohydrolase